MFSDFQQELYNLIWFGMVQSHLKDADMRKMRRLAQHLLDTLCVKAGGRQQCFVPFRYRVVRVRSYVSG